jgi:DNA-binding MarR family transcriptional regulator
VSRGIDRAGLIRDLNVEIRRYQNAQDEFDDAASERLGINRTDQRCMDILDLNGQMTAGQLAVESGLSTGAVTTLLDRLERAGYVRRVRDTVDRRRVLVELTDEARKRAWEIWGPIAEEANEGWANVSDEQLLFLRDFLVGSQEFLARHLERIRKATPARGEGRRARRADGGS